MSARSSEGTIRQSETRYGTLCHFELDEPIGRSLALYGEWAQGELDLLSQFVTAGDVVVDVGANVGTHTLGFASLVGRAGRVISFEPQAAIVELLRKNVALNKLTNVEVHGSAVSDAPGTAVLRVPNYGERHNSGGAQLVDEQERGTLEVETVTLDSLRLERCALVKVDSEGWEDHVLGGAAATLDRCKPVVYAECTSAARGWALIEKLEKTHRAYLHSPPAFNPNNLNGNPKSVFRGAHESSLFFVPRERPALDVARFEDLVAIESLDGWIEAFSLVERFGDAPLTEGQSRLIARRLKTLETTVGMKLLGPLDAAPVVREKPKLSRPVTVIVPIYNGFDDVERLVQSLFYSHPTPVDGLTFVFINDASPDPRIRSLLASEVFHRPDVVCLENPQNRGFIGTVNRALELRCLNEGGTDAIIVNSDTLIFGNVFAILQDVAYRLPNVASVTPLSNNATIASLFGWPDGADLPGLLEPEVVARLVEQAGVRAPLADVPTGIGFCMYMTKQALDLVGGFDASFGKGYCEENAWCQDAAKRGLVNVLTTEAFVYHHGSVSFGDEVKRRQIEKNLAKLHERHPRYTNDVMRHLAVDPYRAERLAVQWAIRRHVKHTLKLRTVLYTLHSDPRYFGGGTEKHVQSLTEHLLEGGDTEVLHLYPEAHSGRFVLRAYLPKAIGRAPSSEALTARFEEEDLLELLRAIAPEIDTLHVHHVLGWPAWLSQALPLFANAKRLITLHDFYAICPSIRLLGKQGYCGVPTDLSGCNTCLRETVKFTESSIETWRQRSSALLSGFHEVLTPSDSARRILARGLATVAPATKPGGRPSAPTIKVSPNFLPGRAEPVAIAPARRAPKNPRVVFLGAFSEPKGAALFARTAPLMQQKGYQLEVWGAIGHHLSEGVVHREYRDRAGLAALGAQFPVDVVMMPATWPETFSFTTFEAVLDLQSPVVVGPFGNPRELVQRYGIGAALSALTEAELLAALERALTLRPTFDQAVAAFARDASELTVEKYLAREYDAAWRPSLEQAAAVVSLPKPAHATRHEPPRPSEPQGEAVRYRIVDATNEMVKTRMPRVHAAAKKVAEWVARRNL